MCVSANLCSTWHFSCVLLSASFRFQLFFWFSCVQRMAMTIPWKHPMSYSTSGYSISLKSQIDGVKSYPRWMAIPPSLKLTTACTWKFTVGSLLFPLWDGLFSGIFAVKLSGSVTGFVSSRWSWMFSLSQLHCLGFRLGRMLYTGPCTCLLQWGSNSLWGEMASRDCCTWMANSNQFFPRNHSSHQFRFWGLKLEKVPKATKFHLQKTFRNSIISRGWFENTRLAFSQGFWNVHSWKLGKTLKSSWIHHLTIEFRSHKFLAVNLGIFQRNLGGWVSLYKM